MNNLQDKEIFEYLMSSDYVEGLTINEYKFLLHKFKHFYRLLNAKTEQTINEKMEWVKKYDELHELHKFEKTELEKTNAALNNRIDQIKIKKLTLKERLSGKININNEIDRI